MQTHVHRLAVLAAALLFSTGGVVIKASALTGFQLACARCAIAALVLAALLPGWRRFWQRGPLWVGLAIGTTLVLFVVANKLTTAANAIFLQSTAPLYVLLLAPWLLRERNHASDLAFAAVLAAGMALFFVGRETPQATAPAPVLGNAVALAAGLSWALSVVGLRWLGRSPGRAGADAYGQAVVAGNVWGAALALPLALPLPAPTPVDAGTVAYLGVFQVGLAYLLISRGIGHLPAVEVSLLLLLEPVLAPVWTGLVHGEWPGALPLAGCLVILAATLSRALFARTRSFS